MPYTNDSGDWSQTLEVLADEHAQLRSDLSRCRCPRCEGRFANRRRHRFGVVSDIHEYYGAIYKCNCQTVFWVISPETGERIEEVK